MGLAPVELFVSNTDVETTEEDVKEALKCLGKIDPIEIKKKKK